MYEKTAFHMLHFEYEMFPMDHLFKPWSSVGSAILRTFRRWTIARGRESL